MLENTDSSNFLPKNDPVEAQLESTIRITSVLLWVPQAVGLGWMALGQPPSAQVFLAVFALITIAVTHIVAVRCERGDWLTFIAWTVGLMSEVYGLGVSHEGDNPRYAVGRMVWVFVAALHGLISGILSKAKDLHEGRYFKGYSLTERLYIVVPFTIGQWFGYVLMNGWSGIIAVFGSIFLCLSTVGYGVLAYKVLAYFGVFDGDLISLVSKMFTTSFGVVFASLAAFVSFVVYLAVPFFMTLLQLNALVSSVGILVERVVYDFA